ncbi:LysM peptidoglycan-binding domain-containing protein [Flavobacterium nackdongense]|uniref:LysM peptidoglycan-binding domain-containing protein n=1 Tax=Flavobacterium nackdongense TaxID=2547394 RepID=A0A4P6Y8M9_9FLAO|nr:LysM peptidoglycan-binding domain-containing protein [Flavobacterium nackdongense]QBN19219.1 LysM peptidoglycan-binding domain-containing protein [Flavobacterium nackdongense]
MKIKYIAPLLFLFFSFQSFSQKHSDNKSITKTETQNVYLDSIKKTFVNDALAACVDSLWLKELTNIDLYTDLSADIQNINIDEKVDYELSTELLKQRLAAMDAKSPFNIEYNPGLENIIKSFLKNRKKSFGRLMAISEYYFPMFEEALAKQNIPLEIKYLAIVESALNPKAVSRMGATGLWQFMYHTGKQYHLTIDSYVDERSDPLKSSEAAANYMATMYGIFGDWDLVLASYNSGPGNVTKAIRRSGGQQNYWNIRKHLPQETQGYVPAFLATMYIYEYHKEHGIKPDRALVQHFATDTIMIKKQMSFKQISDLLDVPVAELQLLNPSYKRNEIPFYQDQPHFLRLPKDKTSLFVSNEDKIYAYVQREADFREKPFQVQKAIVSNDTLNYTTQRVTLPKTKYYTVKRGDNLSEIADKYSVTVSDIKRWNKLKGSTVSRGKSLKIVTNETVVQTVRKEPKTNSAPVEIKNTQQLANAETKISKEDKANKTIKNDTLATDVATTYVVQKGDNLSSIAKKNNVTVADIKEWNHLTSASIQLGMSLQVSKIVEAPKEEIAANTKTENVEYIVKKGDNLGNIAKKFGSTLEDLKLWNNLNDNNIVLGASLIVAKSEVAIEKDLVASTFSKKENLVSVSKSKNTDYLVKKGDSLYSISKKYPGVSISDIKKWNNINGEELKPGMKLKING